MLYAFGAGLILLLTGVVGVWYTVTRTDYLPRLVVYLVKLALPVIWEYLMSRKDPELEAVWRKTFLQGQEWDFAKNKPKDWGH